MLESRPYIPKEYVEDEQEIERNFQLFDEAIENLTIPETLDFNSGEYTRDQSKGEIIDTVTAWGISYFPKLLNLGNVFFDKALHSEKYSDKILEFAVTSVDTYVELNDDDEINPAGKNFIKQIGNLLRSFVGRNYDTIAKKIDNEELSRTEGIKLLYFYYSSDIPEEEIERIQPSFEGIKDDILANCKNEDKESYELFYISVELSTEQEKQEIEVMLKEQLRTWHFDLVAEMIDSCSKPTQELGIKVLTELLEQRKLPAKEFIDWWTSGEFNAQILYDNLSRMLALELAVSGSVRFLNKEYNIFHFGRYPKEVLLKMYENRNNANQQYGFVIMPKYDWNGAFYKDEEMYQNLSEKLGNEYILRVVEVSRKWSVAKQLTKHTRAFGPASFGIISGHGEPGSISMGKASKGKDVVKENEAIDIYKEDLSGAGVKKTQKFFKEEAPLILMSCSTGADEGIGHKLSETFGTTVIAPEMPFCYAEIDPLIEDNKISFEVDYLDRGQLVKNKTYRKGAEQIAKNTES